MPDARAFRCGVRLAAGRPVRLWLPLAALAFEPNSLFHIALRALRVTFFVLPKKVTKERRAGGGLKILALRAKARRGPNSLGRAGLTQTAAPLYPRFGPERERRLRQERLHASLRIGSADRKSANYPPSTPAS